MSGRKHISQAQRIAALAETVDSEHPALPRAVAAPAARAPGRPPNAEKTHALLVRVPDSLHEWLTDRTLRESAARRQPGMTLQTIILELLREARDREPS